MTSFTSQTIPTYCIHAYLPIHLSPFCCVSFCLTDTHNARAAAQWSSLRTALIQSVVVAMWALFPANTFLFTISHLHPEQDYLSHFCFLISLSVHIHLLLIHTHLCTNAHTHAECLLLQCNFGSHINQIIFHLCQQLWVTLISEGEPHTGSRLKWWRRHWLSYSQFGEKGFAEVHIMCCVC